MNSPIIDIAFYVMAFVAVVSALGVVTTKSIAHSVLFLISTFAAVAGTYVIIGADFVAAAQVLIYAGGITILFIFAIMMTRGSSLGEGNPGNTQVGISAGVAVVLLVGLVYALHATPWGPQTPTNEATSNGIGWLLLNIYALPFEVASLLLVGAMIGAIALAQEEE